MPDQIARHPNLPPGVSLTEAQARLDALYWHHSIDFGAGLVSGSSAGLQLTEAIANALFENIDLAGKSLLDIGAWTGAYSFAAKARGAARVVASDKYCWTHPIFKGREAFELARKLMGLEIDTHEIDVPFITPDTVGSFDVVLFSGVFYHLLDPIHLTRQISACAKHCLIIETHQDALDYARPAMVLYPGATLNDDGSNWWGPNPQCMYELLSEFGFAETLYRTTPNFSDNRRGTYVAFRSQESMRNLGFFELKSPWLSLSNAESRRYLFAPS